MHHQEKPRKKPRTNLIAFLILFVSIGAIALVVYYNPIDRTRSSGITILGEYDYIREAQNGDPNYYQVEIHPSAFGYARATRTSKAATADLAIRLGYTDVAILKIKRTKNQDKSPRIIVHTYLYNARTTPNIPKAKQKFSAYPTREKEPHPIFLENLLENRADTP
ncbi:hypothetical protein [Entomospira culicis]|uniref:Uncharacterized protein n=1 Tax=Entomospira culicis TaxID=2719989 RepID=A0A968GFR8_9SPIO|nr:hypothetical protein [Entomospira culicis]NIZ19417.1 hypothetical protein [Entomospira culicis]NIZ69678.1 hypothetical protein [Entomospira culicis]WDI36788.1 hypothetical protein PVA46_05540 [Entomospira culicis]WDI38417.1 hypothetical protein PVA47_05550 [Entomospira culicis]